MSTLLSPSLVINTVKCMNCSKDVPLDNHATHTSFCLRNNFRCNICDEVISEKEKESHMDISEATLQEAIITGNLDQIKHLVRHGVSLMGKDEYGETPLHVAIRHRQEEIALYLVECGADVNSKNNLGDNTVQLASYCRLYGILMALVTNGGSFRS
eukprot:GFYU01003846.1.p1 GENE.GFYU01003846.1~~GFYU01003846.1.p1  ORF type:complete len:156 (-),score=38.33 GFYU01003846.1:741-1208(-)